MRGCVSAQCAQWEAADAIMLCLTAVHTLSRRRPLPRTCALQQRRSKRGFACALDALLHAESPPTDNPPTHFDFTHPFLAAPLTMLSVSIRSIPVALAAQRRPVERAPAAAGGAVRPRRAALSLLLGAGAAWLAGGAAHAASIDAGCAKTCYKECITLAPGSKDYWCVTLRTAIARNPSGGHTDGSVCVPCGLARACVHARRFHTRFACTRSQENCNDACDTTPRAVEPTDAE